jgi:hypothetical protein
MVAERKLSAPAAFSSPRIDRRALIVPFPATQRLTSETIMRALGLLDSPHLRRVVIALIIRRAPFIHQAKLSDLTHCGILGA